MGNTLLKETLIPNRQLAMVVNNPLANSSIPNNSYAKLVFYLGLTLILIQILDGIFTSIGIANYGIQAEGNPILYKLMENYNYILVLIVTKCLAIGIITFICYCSKFINWLHYAMFTVIGIYLSAAIFPWAWILLNLNLS